MPKQKSGPAINDILLGMWALDQENRESDIITFFLDSINEIQENVSFQVVFEAPAFKNFIEEISTPHQSYGWVTSIPESVPLLDGNKILVQQSVKLLAIILENRSQRRLLDIEKKQQGDGMPVSAAEERYTLAAKGANDGIWDWDILGGQIYYSPRWENILGYSEDELGSSASEWWNRVHPDDASKLKSDIDDHLQGKSPHFLNEHRLLHKDGSYRWVLARGIALHDGRHNPYRMAGSLTDIGNQKGIEDLLHHDAMHDLLTGLHNQAYFTEHMQRALEKSRRRSDFSAAVIFLNLDRFKLVNDSLGNQIGDELLKAMALRLKICLRPEDTIARFRGDTFAILLEEIKGAIDPVRVADRIQSELCEPFSLIKNEVFTSASMGIVLLNGYKRPEDVIRDANAALVRAKVEGKARYQLFDVEMHQHSLGILNQEKELRHALERQEFKLYFQPIFSIKNQKVVAMEALLRWQNSKGRLVLPSEFIPLAEKTGLILPLGEWVLKRASSQLKKWHENGHSNLRVSVNLSVKQLYENTLLDILDRALVENALRADVIQLEIAESAAVDNFEKSIETLRLLSKRGVRISIDDFGTNYSAINYLKRFPVDILKIDRTFIQDMVDNEGDAALITAMIAMGHILKLKVVAEGVETQEELDFLTNQDCDEFQGFLFAHPMPEEDVLPFLRWNKQQHNKGK